MVRIKVILSATGPAWGYLFKKEERVRELEDFQNILKAIQPRLPADLELEVHTFLDANDELAFVNALSNNDLVVYVALAFPTPGLNTILEKGVPLIFYQKMYAGHTWSIRPLRKGRTLLSMSSDPEDLRRKILVLYAYQKLSETKYVLITTKDRRDILERADSLAERFNFQPLILPPEELLKYYHNVSEEEAEKGAKAFVMKSIGVIEPSFEEIVKAYRMYLAMKKLVNDKKADGITIDCLSLFSKGLLPAYPCIGFSLLNNEGIPAACEGDVYSLFTMFIFKYLANLPSFISDPVFDTAKNTVIHAHCVAATMLDGAREYPYIIRSHAEDNKGVSLEVKFEKIGALMTVANYLDGNKMAVSLGKVVSNPEINRGCRTKIELSVDNARRMLERWPGSPLVSPFGLHRVLAYGNWMNEIKDLCRLLEIEVFEE
ncbi:MAG: hypothetical protein J7L11_01340 [Thermoprotei archaeon]|nr:hypothetical protein [Thermoprotei archaeon]